MRDFPHAAPGGHFRAIAAKRAEKPDVFKQQWAVTAAQIHSYNEASVTKAKRLEHVYITHRCGL